MVIHEVIGLERESLSARGHQGHRSVIAWALYRPWKALRPKGPYAKNKKIQTRHSNRWFEGNALVSVIGCRAPFWYVRAQWLDCSAMKFLPQACELDAPAQVCR
jgi:hypothetical protein